MNPQIFPCFSFRDLSDLSNSDSAGEGTLISGIFLAKGFLFLFTSSEMPEKRRITGNQPRLLKAFAKNDASEVPSSVIKQRGFSGSFVCSTSGCSSETTLANPRVIWCSGTVNSDFGFRSFFLQFHYLMSREWK